MTREDACDLIANHEKQMFNITYPTCAGTEVIDKIYDDFENRKCANCKHFNVYDKDKMSGICTDESSIAFESEKALYGDDGCNHWSER